MLQEPGSSEVNEAQYTHLRVMAGSTNLISLNIWKGLSHGQ